MQKYNHIFFSAHLDDVIGSCGAYISNLTKTGQSVCVITVFAGDMTEKPSVFAQKLHRKWKIEIKPVSARRKEDFKACDYLGADFVHLKFQDSIYRKFKSIFLYPSGDSLFGNIHKKDSSLSAQIMNRLEKIISENSAVLYFPMSFGNHVDHQILHDVGKSLLMRMNNKMIFYRDFGYKMNKRDGLQTKYHTSDIENKISAFNNYKSQISTLFGTVSKMQKYFRKFTEILYNIPVITVVTVSRGRANVLGRAIESVKKQAIIDRVFHLIIIDDCPDTLKFLEDNYANDTKIHWIYKKRNANDVSGSKRLAKLRNFAIKNIKTEWFSMLDDDNEYEKSHLKDLLEYAVRNQFSIVHSWRKLFFWDGEPFLEPYWPWEKDKNKQKSKYEDYVKRGILKYGSNVAKDGFDGNTIDTSAWLMKTEVARKHPFPRKFSDAEIKENVTEDKKFFQSIVKSGIPIGCDNKPTLRYYFGGYSTEFNTSLKRDK